MKQLSSNPDTYTFDIFSERADVLVFVTSRNGGSSQGYLTSCNIGFNDDEDAEITISNRKAICENLSIDFEKMTFQRQVHEDIVTIVGANNAGAGNRSKVNAISASDALITKTPGVTLFAQAADCVPIVLFDPVRRVAAAVHAGWRGTVKEIAAKTARVMADVFGCNSSDIIAAIGPSIGICCYEVGEEVTSKIKELYPNAPELLIEENGKSRIDLWEANKLQLINEGLLPSNIEISALCTKCHSDTFYSSRKDSGKTGRFGIGITIR